MISRGVAVSNRALSRASSSRSTGGRLPAGSSPVVCVLECMAAKGAGMGPGLVGKAANGREKELQRGEGIGGDLLQLRACSRNLRYVSNLSQQLPCC